MFITTLVEGFLLSISLIIGIGIQNAFVLKQGLKKHHLLMTALTCSICDCFLILLGVTSINAVMDNYPILAKILTWGGAIFLITYGLRSFYSAFHPHNLIAALDSPLTQKKMATFLTLLGCTFLNPHTYIDTFLILGTVGAERAPDETIPFVLGMMFASFVWFFSLTYAASQLSPLFKKPRTWQILDTLMGGVMIGMAINLIT